MSIVFLGSEVEEVSLNGWPMLERVAKGIKQGQIVNLIAAGCGAGKSMMFHNEFVNSLPQYRLMKSKSKQPRHISVCVKPWTNMFIGEQP